MAHDSREEAPSHSNAKVIEKFACRLIKSLVLYNHKNCDDIKLRIRYKEYKF